jgi:proton-dependent oligopeptide transporter, POT family
MFATSLPASLRNGSGVPELVVSMVLVGLGVGWVKTTASPFLGRSKAKKPDGRHERRTNMNIS